MRGTQLRSLEVITITFLYTYEHCLNLIKLQSINNFLLLKNQMTLVRAKRRFGRNVKSNVKIFNLHTFIIYSLNQTFVVELKTDKKSLLEREFLVQPVFSSIKYSIDIDTFIDTHI